MCSDLFPCSESGVFPSNKSHLAFFFLFLFPLSVSSSLYFIPAIHFFFPRFWIVCQRTSVWALLGHTGGLSSWLEGSLDSLQMVRCSSSVPPTHGSTPSPSPSCPLLLCLSIASFLYLSFFSAISFLSPPVVCPFLHFSSSFTSIVLSSTGCLFHLPLPRPPPSPPPPCWSPLSSLHLPIISPPLSSSLCSLFLRFPHATSPPPSPSPSISRFPPETQPAWHTVFTQPVTGCLCLLPPRHWGGRDRQNQPSGGFSLGCPSLNLKMLLRKIDCCRVFFLSSFILSPFSIHPVAEWRLVPATRSSHGLWIKGEQGGWIVRMDHLRLRTGGYISVASYQNESPS